MPSQLIANAKDNVKQNYRVQLIVFQFERTDGKEFSLGLHQLQSHGEEIFRGGAKALIAQNQLFFRENHLEVSTLASPETLALPYRESVVEMGSEVPYQAVQDGGKNVHWKFAGIRLKMTLIPRRGSIKINYVTEVKRTGGQGEIRGSSNNSSANLELGQVHKIFQIGLKTVDRRKGRIPILSRIPLLGKFFTSLQTGKNFKKIIAYIKIEKVKNGSKRDISQ